MLSARPLLASALALALSLAALVPATPALAQDAIEESIETEVVPADELLHDEVDDAVHAEESGGMPQLDAGSWPAQLFWLALIFTGFYFFLSRVALPRVATVLEERRDRIANDLDQAALLQKRGDEALAAYEQSLAEARARANGIARQMRDDVAADTDKRMKALEAELAAKAAEAETRIRASRDAVMANVTEIAADAAQTIVAQITGETPDRARVEGAVSGALN